MMFTRKVVILVWCLVFSMLHIVKEPGIFQTAQVNTRILKTNLHADPEYGLDFELQYTLASESKERREKGETLPTNQTLGPDCDKTITLDNIAQDDSIPSGLFLIESSGRKTLNARQACAVESAVLQSGMEVILIVTATQLDLRDNTTCYLYMNKGKNHLKIYSLDVKEFSLNSPLEDFFKSDILAQSYHRTVHTADTIRLLLIYKLGGLYLDLDYVVLRDLTHYNNMLLEEGVAYVTNSAFMFSAHHPFLLTAMLDLQKDYDPACWGCIGPTLFTGVAKKMTNVSMIQDIPTSADLIVTPMQRMIPVHWSVAPGLLFPELPVSFNRWKTMFENASTVHFFGKITANLLVHDDPQYSAYALLGPRYCPLAYYSMEQF